MCYPMYLGAANTLAVRVPFSRVARECLNTTLPFAIECKLVAFYFVA